MFLSGVSHNDLHLGNIFIIDNNKEITTNYYLNGNIYTYTSKYTIKIYDFDRGYITGFRNQINESRSLNENSYSNGVLDPRDFIIAMCNLVFELKHTFDRKLSNMNQNEMINYIQSNCYKDSQKEFDISNCRLSKDLGGLKIGSNQQSDFDDFYKYEELISKFGEPFQNKTHENTKINYFLDKNFFEKDHSINLNKVLYTILYKNKSKMAYQNIDDMNCNLQNNTNPQNNTVLNNTVQNNTVQNNTNQNNQKSSLCVVQNNVPDATSQRNRSTIKNNNEKIENLLKNSYREYTRESLNNQDNINTINYEKIIVEILNDKDYNGTQYKRKPTDDPPTDDPSKKKIKLTNILGGAIDYKEKYLKYKMKYLHKKQQLQ
jgi:hypothetical protein